MSILIFVQLCRTAVCHKSLFTTDSDLFYAMLWWFPIIFSQLFHIVKLNCGSPEINLSFTRGSCTCWITVFMQWQPHDQWVFNVHSYSKTGSYYDYSVLSDHEVKIQIQSNITVTTFSMGHTYRTLSCHSLLKKKNKSYYSYVVFIPYIFFVWRHWSKSRQLA